MQGKGLQALVGFAALESEEAKVHRNHLVQQSSSRFVDAPFWLLMVEPYSSYSFTQVTRYIQSISKQVQKYKQDFICLIQYYSCLVVYNVTVWICSSRSGAVLCCSFAKEKACGMVFVWHLS